MIYKDFKGKKLSLLGFGTMRLPQNADGSVNIELTREMTDYCIQNGVNYFDTAVPYHGGHSERIIGEILSHYPRDSYYLATKFPGHQILPKYDPEEIFEMQLRKCGVDHFDFYLLHNVYENSLATYFDPKWGIMEYFAEQKKKGRIGHLGFSTHGGMEVIEAFLARYGEMMEFCQLQVNYLDWTLQNAKEKYEMMQKKGLPVWVMEPVRGGRLAALDAPQADLLCAHRPDTSPAAFAFRFLQEKDNIGMILSGMSDMAQIKENIETFRERAPLSEAETQTLFAIAEQMKDSVPCTACRYCVDGCPMEMDIPMFLSIYNELKVLPSVNASMRIEALPPEKQPSACISCGACSAICPQKIDIPQKLAHLTELLQNMPTWAAISAQRAKEMEQTK